MGAANVRFGTYFHLPRPPPWIPMASWHVQSFVLVDVEAKMEGRSQPFGLDGNWFLLQVIRPCSVCLGGSYSCSVSTTSRPWGDIHQVVTKKPSERNIHIKSAPMTHRNKTCLCCIMFCSIIFDYLNERRAIYTCVVCHWCIVGKKNFRIQRKKKNGICSINNRV